MASVPAALVDGDSDLPDGSSSDSAKKLNGRLESNRLLLRNRKKKNKPAPTNAPTPTMTPTTIGTTDGLEDCSSLVGVGPGGEVADCCVVVVLPPGWEDLPVGRSVGFDVFLSDVVSSSDDVGGRVVGGWVVIGGVVTGGVVTGGVVMGGVVIGGVVMGGIVIGGVVIGSDVAGPEGTFEV